MVFILEIAAAIAAYSLQAGLYDLIADKLKMSQKDYMEGGESQVAFDMIQSRVGCIYFTHEAILFLLINVKMIVVWLDITPFPQS